jgi:hypothetical protein
MDPGQQKEIGMSLVLIPFLFIVLAFLLKLRAPFPWRRPPPLIDRYLLLRGR